MKISNVLGALALSLAALACGDDDPTPPDPNATLRITKPANSGDAQVGVVGRALPAILAVKVTNANGAPVAAKTINWTVTGDAGVDPTTSITNADGVASTVLTLGTTQATHTVTATLAGSTGIAATLTANAKWEEFTSSMNGAGENPPLTNAATGTATFRLVGADLMEYTVTATGLTGATGSTNAWVPSGGLHIHGPRLDATGNGSVAVSLCTTALACSIPTSGANAGVLMSGTTPAPGASGTFTGADVRADMGASPQARFDSLLVLMRMSNGLAYTNLHTSLNPPGQARGPIVIKPPTAPPMRQD